MVGGSPATKRFYMVVSHGGGIRRTNVSTSWIGEANTNFPQIFKKYAQNLPKYAISREKFIFLLDTVTKCKRVWLGHVLRYESLLHDIIEGRMKRKATRG